jgi:tetratricopeptide (TPR) repeat protein
MYEQLARTNTGSWELEASRARIAWMNHDAAAAKLHYAKAVELKASDARLHLDYAKLVQGEDDGKAVAALTRAVELDENLREARFMLGYLLYQRRDWAAAVQQLTATKEVTPDRAYGMFSMLAHAQYELGQKDAARLNAEKARKYASNSTEISSAEQLIHYVTRPPEPVRVVEVVRQEPPPTPEAVEPPAPPVQKFERVEGIFKTLECTGTRAKVHVAVGAKRMVFVIQDPSRITIKSPAGGGTLDFQCGPQKPRRIAVEYDPGNIIRTIELFD